MKLINNKPIAIVSWNDAAYSPLRYYDSGREHKPVLVQTVGYLLEYDDEKALLYTDCFEDEEYRDQVVIPTGMIVDIIVLDVK